LIQIAVASIHNGSLSDGVQVLKSCTVISKFGIGFRTVQENFTQTADDRGMQMRFLSFKGSFCNVELRINPVECYVIIYNPCISFAVFILNGIDFLRCINSGEGISVRIFLSSNSTSIPVDLCLNIILYLPILL